MGKALTHVAITNQMRSIATKAGIFQNVHAHLFRHSRITHLIQQGVSSEVVGLMMWGDPTSKSLRTYLHLTGSDVDREMYRHYGITEPEEKRPANTPLPCRKYGEIFPPGTGFCSVCGTTLSDKYQNIHEGSNRIIEDPRLLSL